MFFFQEPRLWSAVLALIRIKLDFSENSKKKSDEEITAVPGFGPLIVISSASIF